MGWEKEDKAKGRSFRVSTFRAEKGKTPMKTLMKNGIVRELEKIYKNNNQYIKERIHLKEEKV